MAARPRSFVTALFFFGVAACGSASSEPSASTTTRGSATSSEAPRPLPPSVSFEVGIPGRAGWFVLGTIHMDAEPWSVVGCPADGRVGCEETLRYELSAAQRTELVAQIEAIQEPMRCEPEGFAPGDPEYTLTAPAWSRQGHLPADPASIPERTAGPCGAPARLAWWIVQRFAQ